MTDKLHLEATDEECEGNWPNNIQLQVLETPDRGGSGGVADMDVTPEATGAGAAAPTGPQLQDGTSEQTARQPAQTDPQLQDGTSERTAKQPAQSDPLFTWAGEDEVAAIMWLDDEQAAAVTWLGGEVTAVALIGGEEGAEKAAQPAAAATEAWPSGDGGGDKANGGSSTSGSEWTEFCRICHDGPERAPLVSACRCTGSMQHVHNDCLIRWILSSFNTHCEICLHRYRIGTTGMRLPHHWKLPQTDGVERYHMMLCLVALVVLSAVISFLIYVSTDEGREARTYRDSPLAPALYTVYAVLGLVCLGLASAELHYTICPLLERFRLTNMNLLVVPFDPDDEDDDTLDAFSADYVTV
ncbi:E3 ubiquitin-protein ligase MARCHF9-like isoform X2 [Pollicipes pollicipes]|nr:E3 ubiquitin-protein ligase MARCHF9-like isoform X2 [Pollicipes pollicipes]